MQRRGARQETHTVKCFHVPSPEPSCCHCVICLSPPHLGDGQEDSSPLRTRKAVSDREASTVGCPLAASVGLQPQTEKERAKACSRQSLSSLPRAQAKKAWGGWSHHPAGSPFLTPPHCVGREEVVELPFPCALRLPICFLGLDSPPPSSYPETLLL